MSGREPGTVDDTETHNDLRRCAPAVAAPATFDTLHAQVMAQHRGFGCGPDSRFGVHLDVQRADDGALVAAWMATAREEGPPGVVHGGIQAVVADAMAGWATAAAQLDAGLDPLRFPVTVDMRLRFRAPLSIDEPLRATARAAPLEGPRSPSTVWLGTADTPRQTVAEVVYHLLDRPWFPAGST